MHRIRNFVDDWYDRHRDEIFERTKDNPKEAHNEFIRRARIINGLGLSKILLNCFENSFHPGFEISNAAGFNKNGDIPPLFLKYLGFDRVVIGTVTADPWAGNEGQTIWRYPETKSMVNCEGLPGIGADRVADNVLNYGWMHGVPLTINMMSTPGKKGDELLKDIAYTADRMMMLPFVDRAEINISCPNTHSDDGEFDMRSYYQELVRGMITTVRKRLRDSQELWLKVSPDLKEEGISDIIEVTQNCAVNGLVVTNTTTEHDKTYIGDSPRRGGASGNAVYERAKYIQDRFSRKLLELGSDVKLIAAGGISSAGRAKERTDSLCARGRVIGIQLYTPLIYEGPKLLRQLRLA